MRKLSIEVQEESGRPGGGHAVIRLMGLHSLPDNVTYRIRPVDTALQTDGHGAWLESDRLPLATRITTEGAELVVGPEIVENPAFMPGTLAVIEVAKCGVRGEFLWPRIAPLVRPKRRHLIAVKPQQPSPAEPASELHFGEASDASSHIEPLADAFMASPSAGAALITATGATGSSASALAVAAPPEPAEPPVAIVDADPAHIASDPTAAQPRVPPPPSLVAPAEAKPPIHNKAWRPKIAAAIAGLALLAGGYFLGKPGPDITAARATPASEAAVLAQLITAGTTSTAGAEAAKLLEQADARLHGPQNGRDRTEAAGLLRRYLAATLGDERTQWALTQLGSVYAEPPAGGQPDYANARRLWELSGALGDPVAMCFVAALHEHGLGIRPDREAALGWYRQAKSAGGCRDVDTAIERLKAK